jgi:hypothetical protein
MAKMRYRLRTLLIVVGALCVWLGLRVNDVRRQRAAIAAIEQLGGTVYFHDQVSFDSRGRRIIRPHAESLYPRWWRLVEERVFSPKIAGVKLRDTTATDGDLELLKCLPHVRHLELGNTGISDHGLIVVGRLRELESLSLLGTSIGDGGIERLTHLRLKQLFLNRTGITDEGVRHLSHMTTLQTLVLDETQITDAALEGVGKLVNLEEWLGLNQTQVSDAGLPHLAGLKNCKNLTLIGTNVSREGLRRLRTALPQTNVSPSPFDPAQPGSTASATTQQ